MTYSLPEFSPICSLIKKLDCYERKHSDSAF
jgi:hypothetical protein